MVQDFLSSSISNKEFLSSPMSTIDEPGEFWPSSISNEDFLSSLISNKDESGEIWPYSISNVNTLSSLMLTLPFGGESKHIVMMGCVIQCWFHGLRF